MKKKLGLMILAAMLVFAFVACQPDVMDVNLDGENLGVSGPKLNDLVGTWEGSHEGAYFETTVNRVNADTAAGDEVADTTSVTTTELTRWNYSIVIGEEGEFTLTATEVITYDGTRLIPSAVTTPTTYDETTTYEFDDSDAVGGALGFGSVSARLNTFWLSDRDLVSLNGTLTGNATDFGGGNELFGVAVAGATPTATLLPVGGIENQVLQQVTVTGTVSEVRRIDSSVGKEIRSFFFDVAGSEMVSYTRKATNINATNTAATAVWSSATTTAGVGSVLSADAEGRYQSFVYDREAREWVLTHLQNDDDGIEFFKFVPGGGLRLAEEE